MDNMEWYSADVELPELKIGEYGWLQSDPVLIFDKFNRYWIATYEQLDDDFDPSWKISDSERWDITDIIKFWCHLPLRPSV